MSAFLWLSPSSSKQARERALGMFRQQAGELLHEECGPGNLYLAASVGAGSRDWIYAEPGRFTAITGTPFANTAGNLAEKLQKAQLSADDLLGGYCHVSGDRKELQVSTDPLGQQFVYCSKDNTIVSTCFLTVLAGLDMTSLNAQALYEYVFFGSIYGGESLVNEVRLLLPGEQLHIKDTGIQFSVPGAIKSRPFEGTFEEAVEQAASRFMQGIERIYSCFEEVDTALSGGFDTRLILAGLRAAGADNYSLHVYGRSESADVKLAKMICSGESLALDHRDKSAAIKAGDRPWQQLLEQNMLMFDGLPTDSIVDTGLDLATRLERSCGGRVSLNGGCGEILRNFFYLPDGEVSVGNLLDTFYRRYALQTLPGAFSEKDFRERFGQKILSSIGRQGNLATRLSRDEVERVYPLFRGRYWTSRNTSINLRLGGAALPFLTPGMIELTSGLPLHYKNYGRLEAAVIARLDPSLASYPSDYGFAFSAGPSLKYKLKSLPSMRRPIWLRRLSYTLQHRRMKATQRTNELPDGLARTLYTSRFFLRERMNDDAQIMRLITVEYLLNRMGIEVS